ncbi:POTE ankyrin domain family member A [Tetrabaena socialis]|uniref:POTE ankyrin domain family member A n=1 Tax=Tetrabaena socialis TaxID=47790 RepID=A0A2J7ZG06_9CHLO|nr:POTE ankyrin domain family member A [Tetrabaena socialis]|eukprot:PNG99196.1 POTE ankyrin domain family member A [Tetrabaena socialis]
MQCGHADVLRALLQCGSQPEAVDCRGWSALHYASFGGQATSARVLLLHGGSRAAAVLDAPSGRGETPLALAAFGQHQKCAEVLLSSGADLGLLSNAADRAYLKQLAAAMAAAPNAHDGGCSSSGSGAARNGQLREELAKAAGARPGMARPAWPEWGAAPTNPRASAPPVASHQFSGSEGDQLASEPVSPQELRPPRTRRVPNTRAAGLPALYDNGNHSNDTLRRPMSAAAAMAAAKAGGLEQSPRPVAAQSLSARPSPTKDDGASGRATAKEAAWELRERKFGSVPLLLHRPTGLLFTSVPVDR